MWKTTFDSNQSMQSTGISDVSSKQVWFSVKRLVFGIHRAERAHQGKGDAKPVGTRANVFYHGQCKSRWSSWSWA